MQGFEQDNYEYSYYDSCGLEEYKCEQSGICINIEEKICNGIVDCEDHKGTHLLLSLTL